MKTQIHNIHIDVLVTGATSISAKRMPSPSPSNNSTNSSTSMVSHEGRKSSNSQAQPKFGKLINFDW